MDLLSIIIVLVLLVLAYKSIKILRPYEKGVVERLGKYQRTVESGLVMIIPFIESIKKVDMREQVVDVPPQEVITKDNTVVVVDCVIFYEVVDPFNAVYNVVDFYQAVTKLAQTNLRNIIGDLELDETLTSREMINAQLRKVLDEATDRWGTRVVRVEIQRIEPPKDIVEAMSKQMKAERMKRAAILEAEGKAEAIKKVADAEKYKEVALAEGQAKAILTIFKSMHQGKPTNDIIALKYLEALEKIANGQATKILLPIETAGILGSIAGISELFKEKTEKPKITEEKNK
ncbi:SPFH domain-containing protein [Methanothermobacter tenebrarum]|uniref:SPFH/Band 7/PHB domain protein n=1 Tax=Methanothermobacter tenebrarum TaxID=680118 RepID=A0A328PDH7_9EURY|nr:SPFH domain-containing protein [Methanothermobacter tenebrarum]NPV64347.1 SPFH/Band 7/PHB domain protein [Methanobacteriaceae archaeon]RAO79950.1 SPFH/Band 7/PHB domain protein [Methanothermobacter tenebrarum]